MKGNCVTKAICAVLFGAALVLGIPVHQAFGDVVEPATPLPSGEAASVNRYNVVIVMDASGSMVEADKEQLRFEAVDQFLSLMTNQGNALGGVVFTDRIMATEDINPVNSAADKERISKLLRGNTTKNGDTNIGEALSTAVDMLQSSGDKKLKSRIVLLSDGTTELNSVTKQELKRSLKKKDDAVKRASDSGIEIYTVCLNADNKASLSELQTIADETQGRMIEVKRAEDLQNAFNVFYSDIYGSYTKPMTNGSFPKDGRLETKFDIPALGAEEINIVIYGNSESCTLYDPEGKVVEPSLTSAKTFRTLKLIDVAPGKKWKLELTGKAGESIRIDEVINTNLDVRATIEPSKKAYSPKDELTINAYVSQDGKSATSSEQFSGYSAIVQILDSKTKKVVSFDELDTTMKLQKDHFESKLTLPEGAYWISVDVDSDYLSRSSETIGPIVVDIKEANTRPVPMEEHKELTSWVPLTILPFGSTPIEIELDTLATDAEDEELEYDIVSTSLTANDYIYDKKSRRIVVNNPSIKHGTIVVRATDDFNAACEVEIVIQRRSIVLAVLIGILFIILLRVLFRVVKKFIDDTTPYNGDITMWTSSSPKKTIYGDKGKTYLSEFGLGDVGLNYERSYTQASGKDFITLYTDKIVVCDGAETRTVVVRDGEKPKDMVVPGANGVRLYIRFDKR